MPVFTRPEDTLFSPNTILCPLHRQRLDHMPKLALVALHGALGIRLLGLWEAIDAVKMIEVLVPCLVICSAAALAV
jgi:hypothetical protein